MHLTKRVENSDTKGCHFSNSSYFFGFGEQRK